jgi:tryptophan halogenase
VANVVAFGDSAVALDPLESTNLLLAQSAIRRAVTLMPDTDFQPLVLQEFNRRTLAECERVRDFVAAHYIAASKRSGPFWGSIGTWAVSDSLAHTLEQFKSRGRLPKYEEETFRDESWFAMMFGLGVYPQAPDPACFRVDESVSLSALDRLAQSSAELPKRLPPYGDYLRHVRSGQTPGAAQ